MMKRRDELVDIKATLDKQGYMVCDGVVSSAVCDTLNYELKPLGRMRRGGQRDALARSKAARKLVERASIRSLVESCLGADAFPVRSIFFDKTPEANWLVPWHQDTTIAVQAKVEIKGFGPWSVKDGLSHVQPTEQILDGMVTTRIHTDPCGADNGPLQVLPASHHAGVQRERPVGIDPIACLAEQGSVVLMKPLVWHASSKATCPGHRRVLHVEWAAEDLPSPLRWVV